MSRRSKPWINDFSAHAAFAQSNLHEILMWNDGFLLHWFIAFLDQGWSYVGNCKSKLNCFEKLKYE